jgi:hypothetical protein
VFAGNRNPDSPSSKRFGGAVLLDKPANASFSHCEFFNNSVGSTGLAGAAYLYHGQTSFESCTFGSNGGGTESGGAILLIQLKLSLIAAVSSTIQQQSRAEQCIRCTEVMLCLKGKDAHS